MVSKPKARREPILIVTHGDGFFDVHGENISVNIVAMPFTGDRCATPLAEDYLEATLSPYWRKLFLPGMIRATGNTKPLTPSKIAEAKAVGALVREISNLRNSAHLSETPANAAPNVASVSVSSTLPVADGTA